MTGRYEDLAGCREMAREWAEGARRSVAFSEEVAIAARAMAAAAVARADQVNARCRDVMAQGVTGGER